MLRRLAKKLVYERRINGTMRRLLWPLRRFLPRRALLRIPIVGALPVTVDGFPRVQFWVEGLDPVAAPLYWYGTPGYEEDVLRLLRGLLSEVQTFLDIGSHIGVYAVLAAADNPDRSVHAFEPLPTNFQALLANIELNGLVNVAPHQAAMSSAEGEEDFHIPHAGRALSGSLVKGFRKTQQVIRARTWSIDGFVRAQKLGSVDLVKIDVEGAELEVLRGGLRTLEQYRPILLCEVLPTDKKRELVTLTTGVDYTIFEITNSGLDYCSSTENLLERTGPDFLLAPAERAEAIASELSSSPAARLTVGSQPYAGSRQHAPRTPDRPSASPKQGLC